jgi:WD40 repeat protein
VECLKFFLSSTGTLRLASGSIDSTILVWNPASLKETTMATLRGHHGPVTCLDSFTRKDGEPGNASKPGSPILVSGGEDRTIRIWDPEDTDNPLLVTLAGHSGPIYGVVCFNNAYGQPRVASASEDTNVRVWDVDTKDMRNSKISNSSKTAGGVAGVAGGGIRSKRQSIGGSIIDPCLMVLEGHSGWVNTVASFTVVGPSRIRGVTELMPRIVSGSMDNSVYLIYIYRSSLSMQSLFFNVFSCENNDAFNALKIIIIIIIRFVFGILKRVGYLC